MRRLPASAVFDPVESLSGSIKPPGDKSISHRTLLIGALSSGETTIEGISTGQDVRRTRAIVEQLGVRISEGSDGLIVLHGGIDQLHEASAPLDCGNSGTTIRLGMGLLAAISGSHHLIGDASLSRRPMDRVAIPLRLMGGHVAGQGLSETPPVEIQGGPLEGIEYTIPVPSAQVKSALLIAGLLATGETVIHEATATRPHTEEMFVQAGAELRIERGRHGTIITIRHSSLAAQHWLVAADPSNAAFFVVAGLLAADGSVQCQGLYPGSTRTGFLEVLDRMGAELDRRLDTEGLLTVTSTPHPLIGTEISAGEIPSLDEVPILTVAAAAAEGVTRFFDVEELRIKESDRFEACLAMASGLGARAWAEGNTLCVEGLGSARRFAPTVLNARGDHRLALAGSIASVIGAGGLVSGFDSVETNYPGFLDDLATLS
jgi:3-phosphoshikimate 1-carboxyvinyltransferase